MDSCETDSSNSDSSLPKQSLISKRGRKHTSLTLLLWNFTGKRGPPKMENIRYYLHRSIKRTVRHYLKKKCFGASQLIGFGSLKSQQLIDEIRTLVITHIEIFEDFADLKTGPKADHRYSRKSSFFLTYSLKSPNCIVSAFNLFSLKLKQRLYARGGAFDAAQVYTAICAKRGGGSSKNSCCWRAIRKQEIRFNILSSKSELKEREKKRVHYGTGDPGKEEGSMQSAVERGKSVVEEVRCRAVCRVILFPLFAVSERGSTIKSAYFSYILGEAAIALWTAC